MSSLVMLDTCPACNTVKYVPAFSCPPQSPRCACEVGLTRNTGTAARRFDFDVARAFETLRQDCEKEDVRDTILRMHSFLALVGSAYSEGEGKAFISGLVSLSALARVLSETIEDDADELEAGSVP